MAAFPLPFHRRLRQVAGRRGPAYYLCMDLDMSNRTFLRCHKVGDLIFQMGMFSALLRVDEAGSVAMLNTPLPGPP